MKVAVTSVLILVMDIFHHVFTDVLDALEVILTASDVAEGKEHWILIILQHRIMQ